MTEGINKLLNVEESGIINLGGSFIQLKEFVKFWTKLGSDKSAKFGAHVQPEFEQTQTKSTDLEKFKC